MNPLRPLTSTASADKPTQYFRQTRPEMLSYIPDNANRIFDIGCGSGQFGAQLRLSGREVWGAELNPDAAAAAGLVLDHALCGNIETLMPQLPPAYFDCIIFNDVLEHLVDPFSMLRNIKLLLAPGGVVVASIPNVRYFFNMRELLVDRQWRYRDYGIMDRTHLRFFTRYSMADMFVDAGYVVQKIEGINGFTSWKFSLLNALLCGHIEDMRHEQFACVAEPQGEQNS